jgi:hypothetical protein
LFFFPFPFSAIATPVTKKAAVASKNNFFIFIYFNFCIVKVIKKLMPSC